MECYLTGPETKRLVHRAFTVYDVEVFFALNSSPDVMRFTGEPLLPSLDAADKPSQTIRILQTSDMDDGHVC